MKTFSFLLLSLILACSQTNETSGAYEKSSAPAVYDYAVQSEVAPLNDTNTSAQTQDQKIIKTANMRFPTNDLAKTHQTIKRLSSRYNGILQNDRSGKNYNELYHDITLRIPATNFQTVIDSIASGVSYFDQNDISQQDVSEEFVDIQARLKAKKELENRYLELLKQAKNVGEILEIEKELSAIREEIEAREGRLQFLENRVAYSTIHINFYKTTTDTGITTSYGTKMWNAVKSGWNGISLFLLGLLHIWPFFVILLLLYFGIKRYLKSRQKK